MDEITKVSFLLLDPFAWGDYRCFSPSRVRPRRVRPVRWQIKGCQTTEPRTFDSGFSGKVNLSLLVYGTPTYLLTSQCVPYYLFRVSPLCTTKLDTPSLPRRSLFRRVQPETQLEVLLLALLSFTQFVRTLPYWNWYFILRGSFRTLSLELVILLPYNTWSYCHAA